MSAPASHSRQRCSPYNRSSSSDTYNRHTRTSHEPGGDARVRPPPHTAWRRIRCASPDAAIPGPRPAGGRSRPSASTTTGFAPTRATGQSRRPSWRRHHRSTRPVPVSTPAPSVPASQMLQQWLVPTAAAMSDPIQVPAHTHTVEQMVVVARYHRAEPCRDRGLGESGRTMFDRGYLGSSPVRSQVKNAPKSATFTASQRRSKAYRYCHHNAKPRA